MLIDQAEQPVGTLSKGVHVFDRAVPIKRAVDAGSRSALVLSDQRLEPLLRKPDLLG
jgi:hypothetical protein